MAPEVNGGNGKKMAILEKTDEMLEFINWVNGDSREKIK